MKNPRDVCAIQQTTNRLDDHACNGFRRSSFLQWRTEFRHFATSEIPGAFRSYRKSFNWLFLQMYFG